MQLYQCDVAGCEEKHAITVGDFKPDLQQLQEAGWIQVTRMISVRRPHLMPTAEGATIEIELETGVKGKGRVEHVRPMVEMPDHIQCFQQLWVCPRHSLALEFKPQPIVAPPIVA